MARLGLTGLLLALVLAASSQGLVSEQGSTPTAPSNASLRGVAPDGDTSLPSLVADGEVVAHTQPSEVPTDEAVFTAQAARRPPPASVSQRPSMAATIPRYQSSRWEQIAEQSVRASAAALIAGGDEGEGGVSVQDAPNFNNASGQPQASTLVWSHFTWWRDDIYTSLERCLAFPAAAGREVVLQQCQWAWGHNRNQLWSLPTPGKDLRIGAYGTSGVLLCLDTRNGALGSGTPVVVNRCSDSSRSQRWFINHFSLITAVNSRPSLCIDLAPGSLRAGAKVPAAGTQLVLAPCIDPAQVNRTTSTQWFPESKPTSYYMNGLMLRNGASSCLAPTSRPAREGVGLTTKPCNPSAPEQQWGTYDGPRSQDMRLALEANFSLCLTAQGGAVTSGTPMVLSPCSSTRGLHNTWLLDESNRLRPGHAPSMCLTVTGSTRVVITLCSSSSAQVWRPTVPGGVVNVDGVPAGSALLLRPDEWIPFVNCNFDSYELSTGGPALTATPSATCSTTARVDGGDYLPYWCWGPNCNSVYSKVAARQAAVAKSNNGTNEHKTCAAKSCCFKVCYAALQQGGACESFYDEATQAHWYTVYHGSSLGGGVTFCDPNRGGKGSGGMGRRGRRLSAAGDQDQTPPRVFVLLGGTAGTIGHGCVDAAYDIRLSDTALSAEVRDLSNVVSLGPDGAVQQTLNLDKRGAAAITAQAMSSPDTDIGCGRLQQQQQQQNSFTQVAASYFRTCAVKREGGTVVCWGKDVPGQFSVPEGLSGVKAVAAARGHICALKQDGSVECWGGDDEYGQKVVPPGLRAVKAVGAGLFYTCVLLEADGRLVCWGLKPPGYDRPPAGGWVGLRDLAAGWNHLCVVYEGSGSLACFGDNSLGQTTVPSDLAAGGVVAIAAGISYTCALKQGGGVACFGDNDKNETNVPAELQSRGVVAIAAGYNHMCAIKEDRALVCWGDDSGGQSTVPGELSSSSSGGVVAVAGAYHTCGVLADGTMSCWGSNSFRERDVPQASSVGVQAVALAGGSGATCYLYTSGKLSIVGGSLQVPERLAGVAMQAVVAGMWHVCALTAVGGKVECFGFGGKPGKPASLEVPPGLSGVQSLSAGTYHTCALTAAAGGLVCWGLYEGWQFTPVAVPTSLTQGVAAVAGGAGHTCALTRAGTVQCLGPDNEYGQQDVPGGLSGQVQAIAAGSYHTCAATVNGTVTCWGGQIDKQRAVPQGLSGVVALAASEHTCALKGKGTVECWGFNTFGQINVPPELSGVQALFAGGSRTAALRGDGQVASWGE